MIEFENYTDKEMEGLCIRFQFKKEYLTVSFRLYGNTNADLEELSDQMGYAYVCGDTISVNGFQFRRYFGADGYNTISHKVTKRYPVYAGIKRNNALKEILRCLHANLAVGMIVSPVVGAEIKKIQDGLIVGSKLWQNKSKPI